MLNSDTCETATQDREWMERALMLARRGQGAVEPNPMVGCVIVRDGICIGQGFHQKFGSHHAEVEALLSLSDSRLAIGATVYVTLEPCCHIGKTPPCSNALIAAGVRRVVVAMPDPFLRVDGGGIRQLQAAGIDVQTGVLQAAAEDLSAPYLKRLKSGRPWTIAKWAMSLDGRIATVTGDSQWISGELSRGEVHRLRGRVDAVIVGGGTVAADNPTLNARPIGPRVPARIVFAGQRLPGVDSNLIRTSGAGPVMIAASCKADEEKLQELEKLGVEIWRSEVGDQKSMLGSLLDELGRREMTNLLVEGGATLLSCFAAIDELDEIHAFIAPKLIGGATAPGPIGGSGNKRIADLRTFRLVETATFDDDIRVITRRVR